MNCYQIRLTRLSLRVSRYPDRTFGEKLRKYRLGKGLRQKDLAKRLEVNEKTIGDWEKGKREPCKRYGERVKRLF